MLDDGNVGRVDAAGPVGVCFVRGDNDEAIVRVEGELIGQICALKGGICVCLA